MNELIIELRRCLYNSPGYTGSVNKLIERQPKRNMILKSESGTASSHMKHANLGEDGANMAKITREDYLAFMFYNNKRDLANIKATHNKRQPRLS